MAKRVRTLSAKPGEIKVAWARPSLGEPPDLCVAWGGSGSSKSDGRIVLEALEGLSVYDGRSLREELSRRGYDVTTLKLSVQKAPQETP